MEYARLVNGVVVELFTPPTGFTLAECFHADVASQFVEVPTGITPAQGWTVNGATWAAPVPVPLTIAQQAAAMLETGMPLTSASDTALNATYPCGGTVQTDVLAEMVAIMAGGVFTNGTGTLAWPDVNGTDHPFTVAQFKTFAPVIGAFVNTLTAISQTNTGTLPTTPVSIA